MLQQTRVATVIPYYERFIERFPDARSLADSDLERVLALWSGLGYYSRARNLHRAAQQIVRDHDGVYPDEPDRAAALPGVGRYTLGAVLSIAYGAPLPVVDGNVIRVLARWFAIRENPKSAPVKERFWQLAGELLSRRAPGDFNQAMMELGATVCTARSPRCLLCPLSSECRARAAGEVEELPVREKRSRPRRVDWLSALVGTPRGFCLVRTESGANRGLWDLPGIESVGGSETERSSELAGYLEALQLPVSKLTPVGRFTHGIMDTQFRVELFGARLQRGRNTRKRVWRVVSQPESQPITARVRKAIALTSA